MSNKKTRIHKAFDIKNSFVMLRNEDAQRTDLSFEALGMLTFLMSLPEDWEIFKENLKRKGFAGRDKVNRILSELESKGYLHVIKNTDEDANRANGGKFSANDYLVYSTPSQNPYFEQPLTENPSTVQPSTVNQPLQRNIRQKKKIQEKDKNNYIPLPAANWLETDKTNDKVLKETKAILHYRFGLEWLKSSNLAKALLDEGINVLRLSYLVLFYRQRYSNQSMPQSKAKIIQYCNEMLDSQLGIECRDIEIGIRGGNIEFVHEFDVWHMQQKMKSANSDIEQSTDEIDEDDFDVQSWLKSKRNGKKPTNLSENEIELMQAQIIQAQAKGS